jgi:hypothetical protein
MAWTFKSSNKANGYDGLAQRSIHSKTRSITRHAHTIGAKISATGTPIT